MPSYRIITLGCKVNRYESLQVEQLLQTLGYAPAEEDCKDPDLVIVNTCAVTASAAAKSRNLLRRYARRAAGASNPEAQTLAMGCWTTLDPKGAADIVGNSAVLGHQDHIAEHIQALLTPVRDVQAAQEPTPAACGTLSLPQLSTRQVGLQRALLKVQDGCDAHCTYCIIPKVRPLLWSRPLEQVVDEARRLVAAGHQEIVLTGIFLGAYGQPTALHRRQQPAETTLAHLIEALCTKVEGLLRLRLSSLEPGDVTAPLVAALRRHPQVMPHFHLPLQSGADAVLRRMNRQYTRGDYLEMAKRLKDAFDRPALTTDLIIGFPGEDDSAFDETLSLLSNVGFLQIHAFPFSPRAGTAAARWVDQRVPGGVISDRLRVIDELAMSQSLAFRRQFVGQTAEILIEQPTATESQAQPERLRHGRSERYFLVHTEVPAKQWLTGKRLRVRIDRVTPIRTFGSVLPEPGTGL